MAPSTYGLYSCSKDLDLNSSRTGQPSRPSGMFRVQDSRGVGGVGFVSSGFRVCRVYDVVFRVQGSGFRVQDSGFRVQGSGFRVQGSG